MVSMGLQNGRERLGISACALRWKTVRLLLSILGVSLGSSLSCLALDPVRYSPPVNYPVTIDVTSGFVSPPVRGIVDYPSSGSLTFDLGNQIRDRNLEDTLYARVFVDDTSAMGAVAPVQLGTIESTGQLARTWSFTLDTQISAVGCHRVELLVSDRPFANVTNQRQVLGADATTALVVWWVLTSLSGRASATTFVRDCPTAI